jgi:hypothetical protein
MERAARSRALPFGVPISVGWRLNETLASLLHLETLGRVERLRGEQEHWRSRAS